MALARYNTRVLDAHGNLILDPTVRVRRMSPGRPRPALFSDVDGTVPMGNPHTFDPETDQGRIGFHVEGGFYEIRVTSASHPGFEDVQEWVAIGTLAGFDYGTNGLLSFDWDAVVPTLPDRDAYNTQAKGFSVLVESDAAHDDLPTIYYRVTTDVLTSLISPSGKTKIGNLTNGGGLAAAFDGTTNQAAAASASRTTSTAAFTNYVGVDWGVGVSHKVTRVKVYGPNNANILAAGGGTTFKLQGSTDNFASSVVDLTGAITFPTGNSQVVEVLRAAITTGTAYRYHRLAITGNGSNTVAVAEVEFYEDSSANWSGGLVFPAIRMRAAMTFTLDALGNVIADGPADDQPVPFPCEIVGWNIIGDGVGSIEIDIWVDSFANFPPTLADSITGGNPPKMLAAQKAEDDVLDGWSAVLDQNDCIRLNVNSCLGLTRAKLTLFVRRL